MMHRLRTVRVRSTLGATLVVLVAFLFVSVTLVNSIRSAQTRTIDNALELRAVDIASLLEGGAAPATIAIESEEDGFVQVVDAQGRILAASDNVKGQRRLVPGDTKFTATQRVPLLGDEKYRVHVHPTDVTVPATIIVGTTLEDVNHLIDVVIASLSVGVPALLALIAALVWIVVGWALRPVEAIRAEVADIGGRDLHRRVPIPPSQDEIGRLAATMNEMLDRLEDSQRKQTEFVSNASHELRTPIAVIRHELEIALRDGDPDQLRAAASDALEEDLRMQRLVDDLLLLARREGDVSPSPVASRPAVDLDDIVLAEVRRRPTRMTIDISGVSAGQVHGNEDDLRRVVRNLLDNALRHATSSVAVHVSSTDDRVVLDIDDDGRGVRPEHRDRIFERFARSDEARSRDGGGTGLGLAIVAELVAEHGGSVTVDRSPWLGGARFTVTLPDARV
jgi:signal transduction histidine kinase